MVKESSALDELAARAQGEISIREAVQELRVWSEQTDFQLTEYKVRNVDICELFDLESSSCADVLLISLFSEQHQQPVSGSNQRLERDVHSSGRSAVPAAKPQRVTVLCALPRSMCPGTPVSFHCNV